MSDEVRQVTPEDDEVTEVWQRLAHEHDIRDIEAWAADDVDGWVVEVSVQEFFRDDSLGVELRQRIQRALEAVDGVTDVGEHDNESWSVRGTASGEALTQAAASVVDELADRLREGMQM